MSDTKKVYVDIFRLEGLDTRERLTVTDSFDAGNNWAWGYLSAKGAVVNDDNALLVLHTPTGKYSLVVAGGVKESGDDWEDRNLLEAMTAAQKAHGAAHKALREHRATRAHMARIFMTPAERDSPPFEDLLADPMDEFDL